MSRKLLVALSAAFGSLVLVPSADAFTTIPVWQCRASPVYASVNAGNRVEPIVANGKINTANGASRDNAQCASADAGAGNTATQIGIPQDFIGARTAGAVTRITPELGRAIDQAVTADAKVENLTIQLPQGGSITVGVNAASSSVSGSCVKGSKTPKLTGTSQVLGLTLGGSPIDLDPLVKALDDLLQPLNAVVDIIPNEELRTSDSLTRRALHLKVLTASGGTSLLDVVVAESKVAANGPVCDEKQQNDGSGETVPPVCPKGSQLDAARNVCIIPAGTGGSTLGEIVVGKPFQGPSGGTVLPIDVARKRFGRSPCLSGSGAPKFAIVGTNKSDRITGTNIADRIIGLGGNDKLDGGRGNDCIEGRSGSDNMSGGLGRDRIYGSTGKDHLNGGPDSDYLSAGEGNDTINAAFGRDRTFGGSGRDFINIATAGPPASADCGPGPDVARINRNERGRVKHCERVAVFNNGDK
jgi:RTX calcium-binding nonapeptide repeat (4 copies)